MYLRVCVNDFVTYNKSLFLVHCHEIVVIVVEAINRQYLHTVHLFHTKKLYDGQLFVQSHVCIMILACVDNLIRL